MGKEKDNIIKNYGLFGELFYITINGKNYHPAWHVLVLWLISVMLIIIIIYK